MKKKIAAILLTLALLAGCQSQVSASSSAADTPDMESIIRQSVDEAVREKMQEYEEEQRKKDEEIARLKDQLEDLTDQSEVPPEESQAEPPIPESQPPESQQEEPAPSQAEVPSQPEPEPAPGEATPPGCRWLNITEATVLTLINKERVRQGLQPLTMDTGLAAAARVRREAIQTHPL